MLKTTHSKGSGMVNHPLHIISIDLGTSSVRASLVNPSLEIIKHTQKPITLYSDQTGKAEQVVGEIIRAALDCINDVLQFALDSKISQLALCFSNAMASLVCLDADFQPLRPALTYMDLRGAAESDQLLTTYGRAFFTRNATPMHASYWLPKFLWMRATGMINQNCRYFCTLKDVLVHQLTGQFVTDFSNAVATGMCDPAAGCWDERLLDIAGISQSQLPKIQPTTAVLKPSRNQFLTKTNLPHSFVIVLGAMDGVLSSLGSGAYQPGQVTTAIGSSGACRIAAQSPLIETQSYGIWSYPLDETIWFQGGAMNNGGLVTQWLAENFSENRIADEGGFRDLFDAAAHVEPGAAGLIFLPYLYGERAPIYDEHARGILFGLNANHHREHMARAGIEGILLAMFSIYDSLQKGMHQDRDIMATGGYVNSDLMLQIQADIFNRPIHVPQTPEGSTIGAAMLAYKALKQIDTYDDVLGYIPFRRTFLPDKQASQAYREIYPAFVELYQRVKPLFGKI